MQFHYIVMYDSDTDKWSLEEDTNSILDGNVWSNDHGWFYADDNDYPGSYNIDTECRNMLHWLADTWPSPKENHGRTTKTI